MRVSAAAMVHIFVFTMCTACIENRLTLGTVFYSWFVGPFLGIAFAALLVTLARRSMSSIET
jgi:phosphate/sulfate permease